MTSPSQSISLDDSPQAAGCPFSPRYPPTPLRQPKGASGRPWITLLRLLQSENTPRNGAGLRGVAEGHL